MATLRDKMHAIHGGGGGGGGTGSKWIESLFISVNNVAVFQPRIKTDFRSTGSGQVWLFLKLIRSRDRPLSLAAVKVGVENMFPVVKRGDGEIWSWNVNLRRCNECYQDFRSSTRQYVALTKCFFFIKLKLGSVPLPHWNMKSSHGIAMQSLRKILPYNSTKQ